MNSIPLIPFAGNQTTGQRTLEVCCPDLSLISEGFQDLSDSIRICRNPSIDLSVLQVYEAISLKKLNVFSC